MIDRPQTGPGRAGAEDGFSRIVCVREQDIRLSHRLRVPVATVGAAAVDTGLVQQGAFGGVKGSRNRVVVPFGNFTSFSKAQRIGSRDHVTLEDPS